MTGLQRSELRRGLRAEPGKYPSAALATTVPAVSPAGSPGAAAPRGAGVSFRLPRRRGRVSGADLLVMLPVCREISKPFLRRGCVSGAVSLERRGSSEPDEEVPGWMSAVGELPPARLLEGRGRWETSRE